MQATWGDFWCWGIWFREVLPTHAYLQEKDTGLLLQNSIEMSEKSTLEVVGDLLLGIIDGFPILERIDFTGFMDGVKKNWH
jgi:hypothetical protein